ncbi:MAG: DUF1343 domain-containing protein, partial [Planctomycetaceae bacterium]|nr:DUF1343 domain-containing protein [Planctomycetaceae bacterium]
CVTTGVVGCILMVVVSVPAICTAAEPVHCGIDVLQQNGFQLLANQRIGLITNHTGVNLDGISTVTLLHEASNVSLRALFSPEHGFEGRLDVSRIDDATDRSTGLKIFSLYGSTRRPTKDMLETVDTLVFDIQDIGARFYTYISTMGEAMSAAAEHHKKFVVLDRPNPINGIDIAGPMLDQGTESFVGFHHLPVRHGMTIGELALMMRKELNLSLDLEVVKCTGWQRTMFWDQTGLTWINPSPNMRCLTQALLYPGIGILETTNLSVGRGTDTPFEVVGAPWIQPRSLAAAMNAHQLPGVTFIPVRFTPDSSKYANEECGGLNIVITCRNDFEPMSVGFALASELHRLYPQNWKGRDALRLLGSQQTLDVILSGANPAAIQQQADNGMDDFRRRRSEFLLYPETTAAQ